MDANKLKTISLNEAHKLADAVACIEASGGQIALVVDERFRLVGTITDGDVRRAILRGATLDSTAGEVMHRHPRSVPRGTPLAEIAAILKREMIFQMPVVDAEGVVVGLNLADEIELPDPAAHRVVVMAGGLGTRLRPITETVPKPMIEVGGRPILEHILERFRKQGFGKISLCVNHLAGVIENHFGDGASFGVEIDYIRETKRMGTAGALSLLDERPDKPLIVMNGDILTSINFGQMLTFHYENAALATMGINRYQYQVPYGVVDVRNHYITGLSEKPVFDFFVNAGIYVISPETLDLIPPDRFFDMPSLFVQVHPDRRVAFPLHEYWLDIGKPDDLNRAMDEFGENDAGPRT
ncbi:nucleotidyltransferase family protein [Rhodopseudomonas palustris]|uniref:Nucleotidyltransferase family protein n=1 Tax=Rhodopseudomonas palustris TaxID=1076 RepID=A0AAX3E0A2_RHOPL|nr:nucleotidyltransferase family protein [Rhodopseudomonas palustris]UYO40494.1 nucleotidyltransferase family protein [Rhodopseudomonas palustris]